MVRTPIKFTPLFCPAQALSSCDRCWSQKPFSWKSVSDDSLRTRRTIIWLLQVLSDEPDCAAQVLPVTRAVAVVGPAQEAFSYITLGVHWPVLLTLWINKEKNMASGPPGAPKFPREAAADIRPVHRDHQAPRASSWWGPTFVWARRLAVETLVN